MKKKKTKIKKSRSKSKKKDGRWRHRDNNIYKSPNSGMYLNKKIMEPFSAFINQIDDKKTKAAREFFIIDFLTESDKKENPHVKKSDKKIDYEKKLLEYKKSVEKLIEASKLIEGKFSIKKDGKDIDDIDDKRNPESSIKKQINVIQKQNSILQKTINIFEQI